MKSAALPGYDVTELVQFEEQPDGSMTVEPRRCPKCKQPSANTICVICGWPAKRA